MPIRRARPSDNAVGVGGYPNITIFYNNIGALGLSRDDIVTESREGYDPQGIWGWIYVLWVPLVSGQLPWQFIGFGPKKQHAKDAACYGFNLQQRWVMPPPPPPPALY